MLENNDQGKSENRDNTSPDGSKVNPSPDESNGKKDGGVQVDAYSLLVADRERLAKEFKQKNTLHKQLLAQADAVRDEVLRIDGAIKNLDQLISKLKGVTV